MHNKEDIKLLIQVLRDALSDVGEWSVYNDDLLNEEAFQIEQSIKTMEDKINN
jgi:hypothetical protein